MAAQSETASLQQETLRRRLPVVVAGLIFISIALVTRMVLFQAPQDPRLTAYLQAVRDANYSSTQRQTSSRGIIYDRTGQRLAVNALQYRVGISANIVSDPDFMVQQLSTILNLDPLRVNEIVRSRVPYALLATNVDPQTYQQLVALNSSAIVAEQIPRRYYPQGSLAGQLIGFVAGDGDTFRGYNGTEGYYERELAGRTRQAEISVIPFDVPSDDAPEKGEDLVLTIDRDIQFLVESALASAIETSGAVGGNIIVMDPMTGDILAMASWPPLDPNNIPLNDERLLRNPAISDIYEPGSVMKVITMAAALQAGVITPDWVYNDEGVYRVGGEEIRNWDGQAYGIVDAETVIVESLNIGASKIAVEALGRNAFYSHLTAFGFGSRTRVDLEGEQLGRLRIPGDETWSESDLGVNAFGQGMSVTPLQMLNAINAIANGGLLMQPRVVKQVIRGQEVTTIEPVFIRRVINEDVARQVTNMMVAAVERGLDGRASVEGYTVAGKTGTAEIPSPVGYVTGATIATFVGFLPADAPQVSILVKLDRPKTAIFASQTAAPVFQALAEQLVTYLEIPTDEDRRFLVAEGGIVGALRP
ncbi:MAG: penicillin-binding protein 2 [Chloroflexi bacterium]|nr:penicillin-binding protein 2 [Chloroflexota bacterium]